MRKLGLLILILTLHLNLAKASEVTDIPEVGAHFPILTVEKNVHPENKMVVYTKVDSNCAFAADSEGNPLFDFYWLMNGQSYKPVHPMIKAEVRKRLEVSSSNQPTVMFAAINDLKELNHDLPDARMTIEGKHDGKGCAVNGFLTLGPSDNNITVRLSSIYTVATGLFTPKVVSVTINGISVQTGQPVSRTYQAR